MSSKAESIHKGKNLGENLIYKEPVSETIDRWKLVVDLKQRFGKLFSNFWVVGPNGRINEVVDSIREALQVDKNQVIELEVQPRRADIVPELVDLKETIRAMPGKPAMVVARGFERTLADEEDSWRLARAGHDWNQNVVESGRLRESYTGEKHMVIVTTIGFSLGEEAYEKAIRSAVGSQFKDGIIEVK